MRISAARATAVAWAMALMVLAGPAISGSAVGTSTSGTDPSDAPSGPQGKTDLRSLNWGFGAGTATLIVSVDESTFGTGERAALGIHVLIDADLDGLADAEVTGTRNADGISIDMKLRLLDRTLSTATCQDLAGTATAAQATVQSAIGNARETFSFTFDTNAIPGGLSQFRWAAFGQSPETAASAGPWDYLPDAANPDPAALNPGDRRCDASQSGLRINMAAGIETLVKATLNIDDNGAADALTDGLLVIRYLFGLTGTALTSSAIGPLAQRSDPAVVAGYLADVRPLLDIDGNGQADALTDGLLVIRYLFGLRGAALIQGAVGTGARRISATDIESYIRSLLP